MATALNPQEIHSKLSDLPGWTLKGSAIEKTFEFLSFTDVMVFVNEVAQVAEDMNHHPNIDIRYNKVQFSLSTHSASGVTEKDLQLAKKIEEVKKTMEMDVGE